MEKSINILVTGATGFIGSHVVEELLKRGYTNIHATWLEEESQAYFWSQGLDKKVDCFQCDIRDFENLQKVLADKKIEAVLHLAAQAIVDIAYGDPLPTLQSNIMGTANVLETCRRKGDVRAIVVASSDKAYGKCDKLPYKEDTPLKGDHPYDVSKTCTDLIAHTYFVTYKSPVTVTRFGNVFGSGDIHFDRIIPGIMKSVILDKELPIRSNGKFVREYVYVNDVSDAYITLFEKTFEDSSIHGQAFNFGSHNIFDVLQVLEKAKEALGKEVNYRVLNIAKNEIPSQYLDWSKTREVLHWDRQTNFEIALKETYDWYEKYFAKR